MTVASATDASADLAVDQAARLAARLLDLMAHRQLSARQLADRAGLGIGTVRLIVNGRGNPTLSTMLALVEALELDGIELLLGTLPTAAFMSP